MAFLFSHTISYMRQMDFISDKVTDLKLITVSDYTATGVVTLDMWENFLKNHLIEEEKKVGINFALGMQGSMFEPAKKDNEEDNLRQSKFMKSMKDNIRADLGMHAAKAADAEDKRTKGIDIVFAYRFEIVLQEAIE